MSFNIRWKLTFSFLLLSTSVIVLMGLFLHNILESRLLLYAETHLREDALAAHDYLLSMKPRMSPEELDPLADVLGKLLNVRVSVIGEDGAVLGDSMVAIENLKTLDSHRDRPEVRQALTAGNGLKIRRSTTVHQEMIYMALPLEGYESGRCILRLALPMSDIHSGAEEVRKSLMRAGLIGLCISVIFGYVTSLFITRRTLKIKAAADAFAGGELLMVLPPMGHDELGGIARSLNIMAHNLHRTMEKLASEKAEVSAVLSSMAEGVLVLSPDMRIISINPAFLEIVKPFSPSEGMTLMEVFRNSALQEGARKSIGEGINCSVEVQPTPHRERVCMVHFSPILLRQKVTGVVAVFNDITEFKRLLNLRKEFVANVSHELKTPLTAIRGFAETLIQGTVTDAEKTRNYLDGICRHANRLAALIDDILYLSKVESKRLEVVRKPLNLAVEAENAVSMIREAARVKGVLIVNEIKEGLLPVHADPKQLEQVFLNFLDNAVKYVERGGEVRIRATVPGEEDLRRTELDAYRNEDFLKVSISDNGPGVPEKDLPRIFERFYRVDKARSRDLGGTGLGLSIVKHIIETHGGKVWVESAWGRGADFNFLLPVSQ